MEEDVLITMVADHEGRMTKLEYDLKDHRANLEERFAFSFDAIFKELKLIREEREATASLIRDIRDRLERVENKLEGVEKQLGIKKLVA